MVEKKDEQEEQEAPTAEAEESPAEEPASENGEGTPAETAEAAANDADTEAAADSGDAAAAEEEEDNLSGEPPKDPFLDPATLRVFRTDDGQARLEIEGDRCVLDLRASRLFPITRRRELVSLCDGTDDEVCIISSLRSLPRPMRRVVLELLRRRYFVPQITRVHSLKDEFGVLYWDVDTTRGRREFVVRDVRDNIREFGEGKLQITDVDGNFFEIADVEALPGKGLVELYRLM